MTWRSILAAAASLALVGAGASAQTQHPFGVSGAQLYNLLRAEGVTIAIWPQASLAMYDKDDAGEGQAVGLSSGGFVQRGGHPCQYSLLWDHPVSGVSFNRSALRAGRSGVSQPEWTAMAFDYIGRPLGSVGEKAIRSRRDVQAQHFSLKAVGIKQLVFWADNRGAGGLCNAMIDTIEPFADG
jgi:hypothetical protein